MPPAAALGATMLVTLLCLGAVGELGLIVACVGVASSALLLSIVSPPCARKRAPRIASIALWAMAAWNVLQLVPLPRRMHGFLSLRSAALWDGADGALLVADGYRPLTIDPPGTAFAAATAIAVAAFFEIASRYATSSVGRLRLARAVVVAVLVFDAVALAHPLFGLTKVYGFYQPMHDILASQPILTPLLNLNHAAAVACVAPPLLIGMAIEAESSGARTLAVVGAIVSSTVAILTLSRGGMAILAFEVPSMMLYALLRRGSLRRRIGAAIGGAAVLALAVSAATYVALDAVLRATRDHDLAKLQVAKRALTMFRDFPFTGAGRGAFGSAFPAYEAGLSSFQAGKSVRFSHAESWPVHLLAEVGLPLTLAFAITLGYAFAISVRGVTRRPATVGAAFALAGLVLHDLADFSMEFAGVGMIAVALLAIVTTSDPSPAIEEARRRSPGRAYGPFVAIALLPPVLLVPHWRHSVDEDALSLASSWRSGGLEQAKAPVEAAIARHPAEPYFHMLAGIRILHSAEAAPHLLRAATLGPERAQTHLWLARWFILAGRRGQAWAEYREAFRLGSELAPAILEDMLRANAPLADIVSVASSEQGLEYASYTLRMHDRVDDASAVDEAILVQFPPAIAARVRQIDRAKAAGEIPKAKQLVQALHEAAPTSPSAYLLAADLEIDPLAQEERLSAGLAALGDDPELLEAFVRRRGVRLGLQAVSDEIARLRLTLAASSQAYRLFGIEGDVELVRKNPAAALGFYLEAAAASPDQLAYLETAATTAESIDQLAIAETSWKRLAEAFPTEPHYAEGLSRVRRAIEARRFGIPVATDGAPPL